ncbi:MAG TPA: polyphosphate kinase 1 [Myxococcales bacterium]|nr:polyphosphate kinase 1 [Myxococcales bacterium]
MDSVPAFSRSAGPDSSLGEPRNFINRELSTVAFLERILEEAGDRQIPLLQRLRFLGILSGALDEFFMIRVAGLKQQISGHVEETGPDALTPAELLQEISRRCHALVERQDRIFLEEVLPALQHAGIHLVTGPLSLESEKAAAGFFEREVLPVLTPMALDPAHPFPHLRNKSLNVAIRFAARPGARLRYGVVPVPLLLPRLVSLPDGSVPLEDLIARYVTKLFPEMPIEGSWAFRLTRNWDLSIDEEEAEDLLVTIEREVRRRDRGAAVRLQINASPDEPIARFLAAELNLGENDVYWQRRPLALSEFFAGVSSRPEVMQLHDEPFTPVLPAAVADGGADLLAEVRERDVLLHHPYESFEPVVSFIESAADDPDVLAIKMTLYRTEPGSPIVRALQRAAENGKQVTALVELKARMDEEANILWARELERSGVHVVYGLIGFKTHCKLAMLVRREGTSLRRYVHLGTGNYNNTTARSYSDLSLFTAREDFAADATSLFNLLTGYSKPDRWRKFLISPLGLKQSILQLIEDEIRAGPDGRIVAKMNALADPDVIKSLYRASSAGVEIDLLIRGICCLRPSVPGLSDRIRVTSVVDRFLEHARVWHFHARGEKKIYLASGDWMHRNFMRRVDVAFPVEAPELKERILSEILGTMLGDTAKARVLRADGSYERVKPPSNGPAVRSQEQFMALARRASFADASRSPAVEPLLAAAGRAEPRRQKRKAQ